MMHPNLRHPWGRPPGRRANLASFLIVLLLVALLVAAALALVGCAHEPLAGPDAPAVPPATLAPPASLYPEPVFLTPPTTAAPQAPAASACPIGPEHPLARDFCGFVFNRTAGAEWVTWDATPVWGHCGPVPVECRAMVVGEHGPRWEWPAGAGGPVQGNPYQVMIRVGTVGRVKVCTDGPPPGRARPSCQEAEL